MGPCAILGFAMLVRRGACMHAAKDAYDDGMIALSEALSEFMLPFGKNSGLVSLDLISPHVALFSINHSFRRCFEERYFSLFLVLRQKTAFFDPVLWLVDNMLSLLTNRRSLKDQQSLAARTRFTIEAAIKLLDKLDVIMFMSQVRDVGASQSTPPVASPPDLPRDFLETRQALRMLVIARISDSITKNRYHTLPLSRIKEHLTSYSDESFLQLGPLTQALARRRLSSSLRLLKAKETLLVKQSIADSVFTVFCVFFGSYGILMSYTMLLHSIFNLPLST